MSQLTLDGFELLSKRLNALEAYVEDLAKVLADMERGLSE